MKAIRVLAVFAFTCAAVPALAADQDEGWSTFGHAPASFRAGRFGIGPRSIGILDDLGYAVESSVTPVESRSEYTPMNFWEMQC